MTSATLHEPAAGLTTPSACPLCGEPLYGWLVIRPPDAGGGPPLVLDRCENCHVALERGRSIDLIAEWEAVCHPAAAGSREIAVPDRSSLQAALGAEGWAAIDLSPGHLLLSRSSLAILAERNGHRLEAVRSPIWGRNQGWIWQTLLNGLTFHPNFARRWRRRELHPQGARERLKLAADAVVTILGGPLVAVVSIPLEAFAALVRRGGELRAVAHRVTD